MEQTTITGTLQTKVCKCCGKEKPLSEFYESRTCKDGREPSCIECRKERKKSRHIAAKEKAVENAGALAAYHPRELIAELRRRGYKGTLTYTHTIEL